MPSVFGKSGPALPLALYLNMVIRSVGDLSVVYNVIATRPSGANRETI